MAKAKKQTRAPATKNGTLEVAYMNKDELAVISTLYGKGSGERKPFGLKDLQQKAFKGNGTTSPARNALRRLRRTGWVEAVKRGTYRITNKGRKRGKRNHKDLAS
jgi:DNA-binding transcriptional regulator PaaX